MPTNRKKVAICHYRIGKTDGVSLEIAKRKKILEDMGYRVLLISGYRQNNADYIIDELEYHSERILRIRNAYYGEVPDASSESNLILEIDEIAETIRAKIDRIIQDENIEHFFVHNIFTLGAHLAAAKGLYEAIDQNNLKTTSVGHDFYFNSWQNCNPESPMIKEYFSKYMPPQHELFEHIVINSLDQAKLLQITGVDSEVFGDVLDFSAPLWEVDDYNRDFLHKCGIQDNDIVVMQATRIVPRKGIELAVEFVSELQKRREEFSGKTLYNGKRITDDSRIVLLLAGYNEKDVAFYEAQIRDTIDKYDIHAAWAGDIIDMNRTEYQGKKVYSLWDAYAHADIVTYPSIWEGWGNQFLEAIFAKKPLALYEYPVFLSDIKPEGYKYISLGKQYERKSEKSFVNVTGGAITGAVEKSIAWLTDPNTGEIVERNFELGRENHDESLLKEFLSKSLSRSD